MVTRAEIKQLVKVKLEELSPAEVQEPASLLAIENNDVKPIESYIENIIDTAYDDILLSVPLYKIRVFASEPSNDIQMSVTDGVGEIDLPNHFLRLKNLHVDCWKRDVTNAISIQHPDYLLQRNPFTRGGEERPVAVINGGKIELYSVRSNSVVDKFHYIERTAKGTPTFENDLAELLVLRCAVKLLEIFGDTTKVQLYDKEYTSLIQGITL